MEPDDCVRAIHDLLASSPRVAHAREFRVALLGAPPSWGPGSDSGGDSAATDTRPSLAVACVHSKVSAVRTLHWVLL